MILNVLGVTGINEHCDAWVHHVKDALHAHYTLRTLETKSFTALCSMAQDARPSMLDPGQEHFWARTRLLSQMQSRA